MSCRQTALQAYADLHGIPTQVRHRPGRAMPAMPDDASLFRPTPNSGLQINSIFRCRISAVRASSDLRLRLNVDEACRSEKARRAVIRHGERSSPNKARILVASRAKQGRGKNFSGGRAQFVGRGFSPEEFAAKAASHRQAQQRLRLHPLNDSVCWQRCANAKHSV